MRSEKEESGDKGIEESRLEAESMACECRQSIICSECGAPFAYRRWTWNTIPQEPGEIICPACRRIANRYPAGYIEVKSIFLKEHLNEILNLVRDIESQIREEHPLERIMEIAHDDGILITTTGVLIAREIGEALSRTYQGRLHIDSSEDEELIRVFWER